MQYYYKVKGKMKVRDSLKCNLGNLKGTRAGIRGFMRECVCRTAVSLRHLKAGQDVPASARSHFTLEYRIQTEYLRTFPFQIALKLPLGRNRKPLQMMQWLLANACSCFTSCASPFLPSS